MNLLDVAASLGCFWLAVCLSGLHAMSSPCHGEWLNVPERIRRGVLIWAVLLAWRGADFASLAQHQATLAGHINWVGIWPLIAMVYTVTEITLAVARHAMPATAWARVRYVEHEERHNPDLAPVMTPSAEVCAALETQGFTVMDAGALQAQLDIADDAARH